MTVDVLYYLLQKGDERKYMNDTVKQNQMREKSSFLNVLRKPQEIFSGKTKNDRQVICRTDITRQTRDGVVKLYKDLVLNDKNKPINVNLIVDEGFPAFEKTLGKSDFEKLKKYYGIGYKVNLGAVKPVELKVLLGRLRTVENAQFYIQDYKQLLNDFAAKLKGAPEDMPTIVKAKLVRMFYTIFVGYYYFAHDFKYVINPNNNTGKIVVDYEEAVKNNNKYFCPEDLFIINARLACYCPEDTLSYQAIIFELEQFKQEKFKNDKNLLLDLMRFAELGCYDYQFVSVNEAGPEKTISKIRRLKTRVHPEIGVYPMETFCIEAQMQTAEFDSLYKLQKLLNAHSIDEFRMYEREDTYLEEARIVKRMRKFYEVEESDDPDDEYGFSISGETEKNRFLNMINYMTTQGFILRTSDNRICDMSIYMPALKFCEKMGYSNEESSLEEEFEIAEKIIALDKEGAIKRYGSKEITKEELKSYLGIDEKFEAEELGILPKVCEDPEEIAIQFAISNGYVDSEEEISIEMLRTILISGNEDAFKKFAAGEISEETLKKRIGFEEEFAEMYFNLKKVEIEKIESFLQDLKRAQTKSDKMRKYATLIKLYCYLVDEKVKCGPKNKVPKGNKGLKTSNLKSLIAAA